MKKVSDIRSVNDTVIYLSDLKEGEKFQIPSMALQGGYKRTYIYTQHIRAKMLIFKSADGNGQLKLPEPILFKLKVERV